MLFLTDIRIQFAVVYDEEFKNKNSEDFSVNRLKFKILAIVMTSISGINQYSCFVSL